MLTHRRRLALPLALSVLTGCASFDPNPSATQVAAAGAVPPAATAPAASTAPQTAPVAAGNTVTVWAEIGEEPLRNAPVAVLDAFTNQPIANVVMVDAGGQPETGPLTTDANGFFEFSLPDATADTVVRVVVRGPDGVYFQTMITSGEEPAAAGYALHGISTINVNVPNSNGTFLFGQHMQATSNTGSDPITRPGFSGAGNGSNTVGLAGGSLPTGVTGSASGVSGASLSGGSLSGGLGGAGLGGGLGGTGSGGGLGASLGGTGSTAGLGGGVAGGVAGGVPATAPIARKPAIRINLSSTLASQAFKGALAVVKAASDRKGAINEVFTKAKDAANAIDQEFGKNNASQAAAYKAYSENPAAKEDQGLGLIYKQLEDVFDAMGFAKEKISGLVAVAFKTLLTKAAAGTLALTGELELTNDSFPTDMNVDLSKLTTGTISYTDPTTNQVVNVKVTDAKTPIERIVDVPVVPDFTNEDDFLSDPTKLAPSVDLEYHTGDSTSPLRLKVSQGAGTFDVKTITASIPRTYVSAVNLNQPRLNDINATTVTGAWAMLSDPTTHQIVPTSATSTSFTGIWEDGSARKVADVTAEVTSGAVTITFTFALTGNNAVTTQGGGVDMDVLGSVLTLDTAKLNALNSNSNKIASILIASRAGADLTPPTTATGAAVNYTRAITVITP